MTDTPTTPPASPAKVNGRPAKGERVDILLRTPHRIRDAVEARMKRDGITSRNEALLMAAAAWAGVPYDDGAVAEPAPKPVNGTKVPTPGPKPATAAKKAAPKKAPAAKPAAAAAPPAHTNRLDKTSIGRRQGPKIAKRPMTPTTEEAI